MPIKQLMFSFQGRINRARYWLASLGSLLVAGMLFFAIAAASGMFNDRTTAENVPMIIIGVVLMCIEFLVLVWVSLAIGTKRCHDRNKSGWWQLIQFIPYIGSLWLFVDLGCLRGTKGRNRFGRDPIGPDDMLAEKVFD